MNHNVDDNSMDVDEDCVNCGASNKEAPCLNLISNDGKRFSLTKSEARCSSTFGTMLDTVQNTAGRSNESVRLDKINGCLLAKLVDWCKQHPCSDKYEIREEHSASIDDSGSSDLELLMRLSQEDLLMLVHAANYLDIKSLFNACCKVMAKSWEGKKVDEIRKMYKIDADLNQEEDRALLLESKKLGLEN